MQDYDLEEYTPTIRAYLTKRWTSKREVPAKIAISPDMGPSYRHVYYQQRIAYGETLYEEKHMKRLYETDAINT